MAPFQQETRWSHGLSRLGGAEKNPYPFLELNPA
jgi:hypothetical protein